MRQVGAVPFRRSGNGKSLEVLLITSRRTGRWIVPKGNIDPGCDERSMAATEAFEEAGVEGKVLKRPLGTYEYLKYHADDRVEPSEVTVYALLVRKEHDHWAEKTQRRRQWVTMFEASELVEEPGLAALLLAFSATRQRK